MLMMNIDFSGAQKLNRDDAQDLNDPMLRMN